MRIDNPLEKYFRSNKKRLIHKWLHYFEIYHRHFERFRGKPVTVLEFGVSQGGSLEMWRSYFGDRCHIYGVDIAEVCKVYENGEQSPFEAVFVNRTVSTGKNANTIESQNVSFGIGFIVNNVSSDETGKTENWTNRVFLMRR